MEKKYRLVLDAGNTSIGCALFEQEMIVETMYFSTSHFREEDLDTLLKDKEIEAALIGSVHNVTMAGLIDYFKKKDILFFELTHKDLSVILDVEEPQEVGADRIAASYGALFLHPDTDLIVVDMGTALVFNVIARERRFLGGAITIGPHVTAKALAKYTDMLPTVEITKPKSCLSRSTIGNIQSGIYYGMIGTIEKIIEEIRTIHFGQGKSLIIATGGLAGPTESEPDSSVFAKFRLSLEEDLKGIIDHFEPDLTFFGLLEILKEKLLKHKES